MRIGVPKEIKVLENRVGLTPGSVRELVHRGHTLTVQYDPGRIPVYYLYSMKARNIGSKTVVGVAWDYRFLDSTTNALLGDHQLLSYAKIPTGKTITLQAAQRTRPFSVVTASQAKTKGTRNLERAVIQCVMYSDGTTWHNPAGREESCEALRKNQPLANQRRRQ